MRIDTSSNLVPALLLFALLAACGGGGDDDDATGTDADTDADSDADSDADTDADSDGDTDADSDVPTEPGDPLWATGIYGESWVANVLTGLGTMSDGSVIAAGYFTGTIVLGEVPGEQVELVPAGQADALLVKYDSSGEIVWVRTIAGGSAAVAYGLGVLPDDSFIVAGGYNSSAIIDPDGPDETVLEPYVVDSPHGFIAKYNPDGALKWARGDGDRSQIHAVEVAPDGSIIIGGTFREQTTLGWGDPNQTTLVDSSYSEGQFDDFFFAKYSSEGVLEWARQADAAATTGALQPSLVSLDARSDGGFHAFGSLWANTTFGPGEENETLVQPEDEDVFLANYRPDGSLNGVKQYSTVPAYAGNVDCAGDAVGLEDGSLIITGDYDKHMAPDGEIVFGEGEPNETALSGGAGRSCFLARFQSDDTLGWAKRLGGFDEDWDSINCNGIAASDDGVFHVTGTFSGAAVFGEGEENQATLSSTTPFCFDFFLAEFSQSSGELRWVRRAGGSYPDTTIAAGHFAVVTPGGAPVASGRVENTVIFGEGGPHEVTLSGDDSSAVLFVAKYQH